MLWSPLLRLTPSNKVWSWPAHRILHHVCEEDRKHDADGKTKDCDVDFMYSWSKYQGPEDKYTKREDNGVSNIPYYVVVSSIVRVLPREVAYRLRHVQHLHEDTGLICYQARTCDGRVQQSIESELAVNDMVNLLIMRHEQEYMLLIAGQNQHSLQHMIASIV